MSNETTTSFREAKRRQESLLAPLEKRSLVWLAKRIPSSVNSDHLTLLGLMAMLGAGTSLAAAQWITWTPLLVPFLLALNWFGDSLDGTIARVRGRQRPRYGFYVDHIVDAFSAMFLLGGLALSGLMTPVVALALLVAFFLLTTDSYLATYAIGQFQLSYFKFSATELRILLTIGVIYAYFKPVVGFLGGDWLLFDAGAVVAIPIMLAVAVLSVTRHTLRLYREERI